MLISKVQPYLLNNDTNIGENEAYAKALDLVATAKKLATI